MVRITCTAVTHDTTLNVATLVKNLTMGVIRMFSHQVRWKSSREKELLFFTARDQPQRAMKRRQS